eukprot:TRINITY_DN3548_c0_g1_i1.p1 TRINITY_DN3548_c0_g1~~TRINITY_DN3548_c0_g1_i1.p1  ORF type:complete len:154 (-),score=15.91 TRINITY_DN3548_c0_g1_i1:75-536(-)
MIHFVLLVSRQGKIRLAKWYSAFSAKEKSKVTREVPTLILSRPVKLCNFIEWKKYKIVYRRYASLFFMFGVDVDDNELIMLEVIHHFVEVLDRYFGNVCELDLIFNFHKAYFILDEILMAGELQETNKKMVLRIMSSQDALQQTPEQNKIKEF